MKDFHINVFYSEEDVCYVADIPDLKFCSACGASPEEAVREVQIAKAAWLKVAKARGKSIPEPRYRPASQTSMTTANPSGIDPWIAKDPGPFRVGDRVRMPFGSQSIGATIVEDRGNLGVGGTRIYGVCFRADDDSGEIYTERNVDRLTLVARTPEPAPKAPRKKRSRE